MAVVWLTGVACGDLERGRADDDDTGSPDARCDGAGGMSPDLLPEESEVLRRVNEARAMGGSCGSTAYPSVPPLEIEARLQCAARLHSEDMVARDFFDHVNPDGDDPFARMAAAGYRYRAAGENIADGYPGAAEVVAGWMSSPGHCRNILSADFTQTGIGLSDGASRFVWTQTFGDPW